MAELLVRRLQVIHQPPELGEQRSRPLHHNIRPACFNRLRLSQHLLNIPPTVIIKFNNKKNIYRASHGDSVGRLKTPSSQLASPSDLIKTDQLAALVPVLISVAVYDDMRIQ